MHGHIVQHMLQHAIVRFPFAPHVSAAHKRSATYRAQGKNMTNKYYHGAPVSKNMENVVSLLEEIASQAAKASEDREKIIELLQTLVDETLENRPD